MRMPSEAQRSEYAQMLHLREASPLCRAEKPTNFRCLQTLAGAEIDENEWAGRSGNSKIQSPNLPAKEGSGEKRRCVE